MTDQEHEPTQPEDDTVFRDEDLNLTVDASADADGHHPVDDQEPASCDDRLDEDDLLDEDDDQLDVESLHPYRRTMNVVNALKPGVLTVCYPERDVQIPLDGDAAMRTLAAFRHRRRHEFEDALDPTEPIAGNAWAALEMNPLAMWWLPGLPPRADRMTIDPDVIPS